MSNKIKNRDIFQAMEAWAPLSLAFDWDNVGLQIGSYEQSIKKVMITLDVTEAVVDEAINQEVSLIIAHHPLLFKSMKQININSVKGKIIQKCLSNNISVYASHTNLDITKNGVNDVLCNKLGIEITDHLVHLNHEKLFKFIVYTPVTHAEKVRNALSKAGAGHIGNYSHCTFQTEGNGTFKPLKEANPYIGVKDTLEMVKEVKIETIVNQSSLANVLQTMKTEHPYEEPAYDIFQMENKGETIGLGRIGKLSKPMSLQSFAEHTKGIFKQSHVKMIGSPEEIINKVAVLGGSGEKYIMQAKQKGVDVYITGDVSFHHAQDALEMGISVIDAGHYIEGHMKESIQQFLEKKFGQSLEIIISRTNTDPYTYI